jgi:Ca-activated chloride channel family protein
VTRRTWYLIVLVIFLAAAFLPSDLQARRPGDAPSPPPSGGKPPVDVTPPAPGQGAGALVILGPGGKPTGECPLKHTSVQAHVSGMVASVTVTQNFHNPGKDKIEALYTFPLPQDAAVYDMEMKVGKRTIRGLIKPRDEARRIYEQAREQGHVASLLDQERPNIFTQSVANIEPGAAVDITIRYSEVLPWKDGFYSFVFPMVVGPRYIPGDPQGRKGTGWAPDTEQVPDGSRITPPVAAKGTRAGHDISLELTLDAGSTILDLRSELHEVQIERQGSTAKLRLADKATIPNRDFIVRYSVAGKGVQDSFLAHSKDGRGHFVMVLEPPLRPQATDISPKELVFVVDTSGSMSGAPMEKCKETMELCLAGVNPKDTFNVITFSGDTRLLFEKPVPATPENIARARAFLSGTRAGGGTEMMKAIEVALAPSKSASNSVRIVTFMTDGYVGNDMAIISAIQKHSGARVFPFGIGQSVNRFLLDGMAAAGRGEVEYVTLNERGEGAARRFFERVRNPVLLDVSVDWGNLPVEEVLPRRIPDLFSSKPVVLTGRFSRSAEGTVVLRGYLGGKPWERSLQVRLPRDQEDHEVLGQLWARAKVADLMNQDWLGMQRGKPRGNLKEEITRLGLDYRIMTQFTSFVAVEEMVVTEGGRPRTVAVPVEMPEGVSHEGVFGESGLPKGPTMSVSGPAPGGFSRAMPSVPSVQAVEGWSADRQVRFAQEAPQQQATTRVHPKLLAARTEASNRGWTSTFLHEGIQVDKGRVQAWIWLKVGLDANLRQKLEALGVQFQGEASSGRMLVVSLPLEKLEEIALLEGVRYVDPAR